MRDAEQCDILEHGRVRSALIESKNITLQLIDLFGRVSRTHPLPLIDHCMRLVSTIEAADMITATHRPSASSTMRYHYLAARALTHLS